LPVAEPPNANSPQHDHVIDDRPTTHYATTLALLGAIPFLILVVAHWRLGPLAVFGDWAQYLLHADAIRHGRSYGDIGYIFTPRNPFIGPPLEPPGLPAVLVPLLAITGGARESAVYKVFMVCCGFAFLWAVAAYFARHGSRPLIVATVLVTGLSLEIGFATNTVTPDAGFCAIVWVMFCLADRPGRWGWGRVVAITLLGFAALAFRLAGLPLLPAVALYALIHRRVLGFRPWIPVLTWGLAGLAAAAAAPGVVTFARLVPRDPGLFVYNVTMAARVYPFGLLEYFLYPLPWNAANDAYHVVIAFLAVLGAIVWVPGVWSRCATLFAACTLGMLAVVPFRDTRYLMPIAPLAVYSAGVGIATVIAGLARLTRRLLPVGRAQNLALALVAMIVVASLVRALGQTAPPVLGDVAGVRSVFARLEAANATAPARVVFMNPRALTWHTGVPAMGFVLAVPDTTLAEFRARRITHVVVGDVDTDPKTATSIAAAVAARPAAFRRLFADGPFTIYAFDSTRATPE
jgi:hypothetical protein